MGCLSLSAERARALYIASGLRQGAAETRLGAPQYVGCVPALEALADTFCRCAHMVEACAGTDKPLAGVATLAEMQSVQCAPGSIEARA